MNKRPGHQLNDSFPSSTEVKNEWINSCSPPICIQGMYSNICTLLSFVTNSRALACWRCVYGNCLRSGWCPDWYVVLCRHFEWAVFSLRRPFFSLSGLSSVLGGVSSFWGGLSSVLRWPVFILRRSVGWRLNSATESEFRFDYLYYLWVCYDTLSTIDCIIPDDRLNDAWWL